MTASDGLAAIQNRILQIQQMTGAAPAKSASSTTATSTATSTSTSSSGTQFASALSEATSSVQSADIAKYPNGKIPEHLLMSIGGKEKLAAPAAKSFLDMKGAAAQAGINLPINDSYRSYDEQVAMAKQKGIYGQGGLAAVPGRSSHGKGISLDIEMNSANQKWMQQNASKYGWVNDVKGEPWHWTYKR